ncbi:MAG: tRNA (guanine-N(1)-)-methyltransferase [Cyclobacteriaceae bacterium]|nr:MAG: tRNA (guanine-N(1)-)-methyltransferase [Cyclobacteriaceae bacterium]
MRIDIITVLPELLESFLNHSIVQRAQDKGLVTLNIHNLRDYSVTRHRTVDDYAYGGGAGMVLMIEPIVNCLEQLKETCEYQEVIYMSPDGDPLQQSTANELSLLTNIIILCGHYKGIDERLRQHFITREVSIGDYVLSGGELPAAVLSDAIIRLIPGVLSDESSALSDSFQDGLVAPPVYTRPADFRGMTVPSILLSGHQDQIEKWRFEQSLKRTKERRPESGSQM